MHIFVTGGAGYVGSHCVRALLDAGHAVTVFDNLMHGHRAAVDRRAALIQGDLAEPAAISAALAAAPHDAVMHFAGLINVGESVSEPVRYFRANTAYTMNLLDAMRDAGVKRLVFSSTCAVYGPPEQLPLVESMPRRPISPYGESKLAVEWLLAGCATAWGLGSVALRYFNASGAAADASIGEDHQPETHLIPLILQVALGQRDAITIFGDDYPTPDGTCVRDYVHVEDLAAAHIAAVQAARDGVAACYNVGTGSGNSVLEVIEAARSVTGHEIPVRRAARRPGDPPGLYADPALIRRELNWSPRWTSIREIVASAWKWHSANPRGYRNK